jgi:hypothetical protein
MFPPRCARFRELGGRGFMPRGLERLPNSILLTSGGKIIRQLNRRNWIVKSLRVLAVECLRVHGDPSPQCSLVFSGRRVRLPPLVV